VWLTHLERRERVHTLIGRPLVGCSSEEVAAGVLELAQRLEIRIRIRARGLGLDDFERLLEADAEAARAVVEAGLVVQGGRQRGPFDGSGRGGGWLLRLEQLFLPIK
jgi:hypothetical protein